MAIICYIELIELQVDYMPDVGTNLYMLVIYM